MDNDPSQAEIVLAQLDSILDELRRGLENACATEGKTPVSSPLLALSQVTEFLKHFDNLRPLMDPLEKLRAALYDVHRGVRAQMFEPVNVANHRGANSNRERKIRAAAMIAIDLLMASGSGLEDAVEHVRSRLTAAGVQLGRDKPRAISTAALKKWREESTGYGNDGLSKSSIMAVRTDLEEAGKWPPDRQLALAQVESIVSDLSAKN